MNFFAVLFFANMSLAVEPGASFKAVPSEDSGKVCATSLDRIGMENAKAKSLQKADLEFISQSCSARHKAAVAKCKKTIADKKESLAKVIKDKKELDSQVEKSLMPEQFACMAKAEQGAAEGVKLLGTLFSDGKGAKAKATVEEWKKEAK